jgi:uncharacterized UBP type Zn finger protein
MPRRRACEHLSWLANPPPAAGAFCEDCGPDGDASVALRVCVTCGYTGCAEGTPANHAAQHYAETDHPLAAMVGPTSQSRWCYPDQRPVGPPTS